MSLISQEELQKMRIKTTKQTTESYSIEQDEDHFITYTKTNGKPVGIFGKWGGKEINISGDGIEIIVELIESSIPKNLPQYPPGTRDLLDKFKDRPPQMPSPISFNEAAYVRRSIDTPPKPSPGPENVTIDELGNHR